MANLALSLLFYRLFCFIANSDFSAFKDLNIPTADVQASFKNRCNLQYTFL